MTNLTTFNNSIIFGDGTLKFEEEKNYVVLV